MTRPTPSPKPAPLSAWIRRTPRLISSSDLPFSPTDNTAQLFTPSTNRSPAMPIIPIPITILGITLHADGNLPAAITAYRQAIHLNPAFWEAHSNLALILHEQNKLDEAIAEYREAKRLAPKKLRFATIWATLIATKATSTLPFANCANFTASIPSGSRDTVAWPAPTCRRRTTAAPSRIATGSSAKSHRFLRTPHPRRSPVAG